MLVSMSETWDNVKESPPIDVTAEAENAIIIFKISYLWKRVFNACWRREDREVCLPCLKWYHLHIKSKEICHSGNQIQDCTKGLPDYKTVRTIKTNEVVLCRLIRGSAHLLRWQKCRWKYIPWGWQLPFCLNERKLSIFCRWQALPHHQISGLASASCISFTRYMKSRKDPR